MLALHRKWNISHLAKFYFSIHDWYNKGLGMCYPAYGIVLLIEE